MPTTILELIKRVDPQELFTKLITLAITLRQQGRKFDLDQDVSFASGYVCKPLHILLAEGIPDQETNMLISSGLQVFQPTVIEQAKQQYKDNQGRTYDDFEISMQVDDSPPVTQKVQSSATNRYAMFADKSSRPIPVDRKDRILTAVPYGRALGIGFKIEQLQDVIRYDAVCLAFSERQPKTVVVNDPISLPLYDRKNFEQLVASLVESFGRDPYLKMTLTPVFLMDKGYELLLTTLKKEDGKLAMVIAEMIGKDKFEPAMNAKFRIEEIITERGVQYVHHGEGRDAIFQGKTVYSCCGLMTHLIFNVMDSLPQEERKIDVDTIIGLLSNTSRVELAPTIERANQAIIKAIEYEDRERSKQEPTSPA